LPRARWNGIESGHEGGEASEGRVDENVTPEAFLARVTRRCEAIESFRLIDEAHLGERTERETHRCR
jgi:hypothetical protein